MRQEDFEKIVNESLLRRTELTKNKREDYASEQDVLSNFKRVGEAVKTLRIPDLWQEKPALAYALFMEVMKMDRIINILLKGNKERNEPLTDSWDDMKNYVDLAEAIFIEDMKENE